MNFDGGRGGAGGLLLSILTVLIGMRQCFIPAELFTYVVNQLGTHDIIEYGEISDTIVHEELLRRGVIASVTQYFLDKRTPGSNVSWSNLTDYYQDIRNLYYDQYGVWICQPKLDLLLKTQLQIEVAIVDLDPRTKDLPYAHFDAETFVNSNQRVINFTSQIFASLSSKDYSSARSLAGQIMHTIQDFYSHSNWVEMGQTQINTDIGTAQLPLDPIATLADNVTCVENCTLVSVPCSGFISSLSSFLQAINFHLFTIKCPTQYFKCQGNLVQLNKLVSGYYSGQHLDDGTPVQKPQGAMKCSHGGLLDGDQFIPAAGGINKDSGYYLFSPHADLHLTAAALAINHSAYFFNSIRSQIGDAEYNNFLSIEPSQSVLTAAQNNTLLLCSACSLNPTLITILVAQCLLVLHNF